MTEEEILEVQSHFEEEAQSLNITYWEDNDWGDLEGFLAAKKEIAQVYAEKYPEWAVWSEKVLNSAVG